LSRRVVRPCAAFGEGGEGFGSGDFGGFGAAESVALPSLRPTLVASPTERLIELVLDRPLNDQLRAEPREFGQHPRRPSTILLASSLSMLACISADGGTVRLTA
jgi:hypothetical protein